MPQTIRILLADDHKIVRDGLRSVLDRVADFEVVAEADDGQAAIDSARKEQPDVVVMDVGMSRLNGVEATRRLLELAPATRVVALSMHSERVIVSRMLQAGAAAYLLKDCAVEELETAIRSVVAGKSYLSASISDLVVDDYRRQLSGDGEHSPVDKLTPREREVLQLMAEGLATKEIAFRLGVSVKTIETHRKNLMDKLDLHSVAELTKLAVREGLSSLEE